MTRPTTFAQIVGQSKVKSVVQVLTKSAQSRQAAIPHIIFSGPAGTGKTTFARVTAEEARRTIKLANGGNISNTRDLLVYVESIEPHSILFIDEIHAIPRKVQETLYTIMEDFRFEKIEGKKAWSLPTPEFTLIGATTDIGLLTKPMRDRFKFVAEFEPYSLDELSEIVKRVAATYGFKFNQEIAEQIAKTCRSNPRQVVSRTEWVRDYMVANNRNRMTREELAQAIELQGFDADGLREIDKRYLECLSYNGTSLANIAKKLGIQPNVVEFDIEPYLLAQNLVEITKKGRVPCGKSTGPDWASILQ